MWLVVMAVQVRDVIVTFHKRRRGLQLMYKFRQAGGKLPPSNDDAAVEACLRRLRLQDDQGVITVLHRHTLAQHLG